MPEVAVQQRESQSSTQHSDFKKVRVRWLKKTVDGRVPRRRGLQWWYPEKTGTWFPEISIGSKFYGGFGRQELWRTKFFGLPATLSGVFCTQHIVVLSRSRVEYWNVMLSTNQQAMNKPRYFAYLLTALWRSVRYDTFIQTRKRTRMMHHFKNNYKKWHKKQNCCFAY